MVFFNEVDVENIMWGNWEGTIPKLRPQWKILLEFLPLAARTNPLSLWVLCKEQQVLEIQFPVPNMSLTTLKCILPDHQYAVECKAPFLEGDWSKVEITHEKEEGEGEEEFTLTLSVGGEEVGRFEAVPPNLSKLCDLRLWIGYRLGRRSHIGAQNIRGLVVLDKP